MQKKSYKGRFLGLLRCTHDVQSCHSIILDIWYVIFGQFLWTISCIDWSDRPMSHQWSLKYPSSLMWETWIVCTDHTMFISDLWLETLQWWEGQHVSKRFEWGRAKPHWHFQTSSGETFRAVMDSHRCLLRFPMYCHNLPKYLNVPVRWMQCFFCSSFHSDSFVLLFHTPICSTLVKYEMFFSNMPNRWKLRWSNHRKPKIQKIMFHPLMAVQATPPKK